MRKFLMFLCDTDFLFFFLMSLYGIVCCLLDLSYEVILSGLLLFGLFGFFMDMCDAIDRFCRDGGNEDEEENG